ncbi:hypothetical protein K438DRAFT_1777960 [Mycena galopus ATCC 62051]|nr:hypothetical protein K438DRAFT_1777960 [Mycena galopus ATCC 62051]
MHSASPETAENILGYTGLAANALQNIAVVTQTPFLNSVSTLSLTIIGLVEKTKIQKERYLRIVDGIHHSLCALMSLCMHSEEIRSPKLLEDIAHYASTLQKLHSCLRAQRELGTHQETAFGPYPAALNTFPQAILKVYSSHIQDFLPVFNVFKFLDCNSDLSSGASVQAQVAVFPPLASSRPQALRSPYVLFLFFCVIFWSILVTQRTRYMRSGFHGLNRRWCFPDAFKRFFKQSEISTQLDSCEGELRAALQIFTIKYGAGIVSTLVELNADAEQRHQELLELISSQSVSSNNQSSSMQRSSLNISCAELMIKIGLHLRLEPSRLLSKTIVHHLRQCGSCLLVLDNFETPWEPLESRRQVEEFLSLLADIPSLALLVTMRGAERPGKVKWTRPFLPPLEPLPTSASRQIFLEVAEDPKPGEESALDDLLDLSGSLPLAVSLIANIASFEGYSGTLSRWQIENITLLSDGHDKRSNLEKSITLSLNSPRISSSPHAKNLLSLLSLLPDGIRAEEIIASHVPIADVRSAQALLIGTSLAYVNAKERLTALSPIREYIRRSHPPSIFISRPLRVYFEELLRLWRSTQELPSGKLPSEMAGYLGNINQLILEGLVTEDKSVWESIGCSIVTLDAFSVRMIKGNSPLFQRLPHLIQVTDDAKLRWTYGCACLRNPDYLHFLKGDAEVWIKEGLEYFDAGTRPVDQAAAFYNAAAAHYKSFTFINLQKAVEFNKLASALAQDAQDIKLQLMTLRTEYDIARRRGEPHWQLDIVHRARDLMRFTSNPSLGIDWIEYEARVNLDIGNMSRALDICAQAEDMLVSGGMRGSDLYLGCHELRAVVHFQKSEYVEARQLHEQISKETSSTSAPLYHANSLINIAFLDILIERPVAGILANMHAAEVIWQSLGAPRVLACSYMTAELKLYSCGDAEEAREEFLQCLAKSRGLYQDLQSSCLAALGNPRNGMYSESETSRWAVVSLAFVQKMKDVVGTLNALQCLADVYSILNDGETALNLFHAALDGGTDLDIHCLRAECMVGIGNIMLRHGDLAQAEEMWTGAYCETSWFRQEYSSQDENRIRDLVDKTRSSSTSEDGALTCDPG